MKKKKLNLAELNVKSFVTNMDAGSEQTVKGGALSYTNEVTTCIIKITDDLACLTMNWNCGPTYGLCAYTGNICLSDIECPAEV